MKAALSADRNPDSAGLAVFLGASCAFLRMPRAHALLLLPSLLRPASLLLPPLLADIVALKASDSLPSGLAFPFGIVYTGGCAICDDAIAGPTSALMNSRSVAWSRLSNLALAVATGR